MIKRKLEIAASHHPWRSITKLFLKLSWLEKMFENTPSWVMTDTYTQSWIIPKNALNKKYINSFTSTSLINIETMLYFRDPPEGFFLQRVNSGTLVQFYVISYMMLKIHFKLMFYFYLLKSSKISFLKFSGSKKWNIDLV